MPRIFRSASAPPALVTWDAGATAQSTMPMPMPAKAKKTAVDRMPVEILVQVFLHLDMATAHSLASTNRRFATIFAAHRAGIVLRIAETEFAPFDGLLQVVKASPSDTLTPGGTWLFKRIRRGNTVLCPGGTVPATGASRHPQHQRQHQHQHQSRPKITCAEVTLEDADIDSLLSVCRVARGWERIFPQHRFNAVPHMARSLTPRENERLRRALYTWMRYAFYFHGDLPRPSVFFPNERDVRVNQLRVLSNDELGALKDLWMTAEGMIKTSLCPSIEHVRKVAACGLSEKDAARIGWGRWVENHMAVSTMRKLSPKELLFYLDNGHNYTKVRLIQDIRRRHPGFEADVESLTCALATVVSERWDQTVVDLTAAALEMADNDDDDHGGLDDAQANAMLLPVFCSVDGSSGGGILDWTGDGAKASNSVSIGDMTGLGLGLGLDGGPESVPFHLRRKMPRGVLDP